MKGKFLKCFLISLSILGAVIGVGFSSGKEIVFYFAKYGNYGYILCVIAGVLFGIFSYMLLKIISYKNNHKNKKCKNDNLCLKSYKTIKFYKQKVRRIDIFSVLVLLCEFIICTSMFAGIDSLFITFGLSFQYVYLVKFVLSTLMIFLINCYNDSAVIANQIVSIFILSLFGVLFVVSCKTQIEKNISYTILNLSSFLLPICFVAMNVFTAYPIYEKYSEDLSKKERYFLCVFVGAILTLILFVVCYVINSLGFLYLESDMLLVQISNSVNKYLGTIYSLLVSISLFSTLLTSGCGIVNFFKKRNLSKFYCNLLVIFSFLLSFVGFGFIVDVVYPVIGIVCMLYIFIKFVKNAKNGNLD